MVSSIGLAMVLAFEPAEPGIMNRAPRVLGVVGLVVVLQVIMTYTPVMQTWFATTSLSVGQMGMILAAGVILLIILELEKLVTRLSGKAETWHT